MFVILAVLQTALAATAAEEAALEQSQRRLRGMVNSCRNSSSALNASGRIDLEAQAHMGELVSLMIHSEVGNEDLIDCFCVRTPIALRDWIRAVETDAFITLPFILTPENGSAGYSGSRRTMNCPLQLAPSAPAPEPELILPDGAVSLSKVKSKGSLDSDVVHAALQERWEPLERCYRSDLIRYAGYSTSAQLRLIIGPDGAIASAVIDGVAHNSIINCQVQELLTMRLPTSSGVSEVKAKLEYAAGE
jgi:hypothetical protein